MAYQSAVYKLNHSKKTATKIGFNAFAHNILPKSIDFSELATIISTMQKKCFKDNNENNENTERIIDLFTTKSDRTVAVVVSLGYLPTATNHMDFIDGGSATIQKSRQGFLERQQFWINEVCRAKILAGVSPIKSIMEMIDRYITTHVMNGQSTIDGAYLYVEKHPEHGNPDFLLDYYATYGYILLPQVDDDYFYMRKSYPKPNRSKAIPVQKKPKNTTRRKSHNRKN
jgi:hypothetical protein